MTRKRRMLSRSGYMHIISRGANKQDLFYDDNDRENYLKFLMDAKTSLHIEIVAYCLMSNHVHLLIRDRESNVSSFMHDLCTRYAKYFNDKYDHSGHLFENRFTSRAIETEQYLLICLRYIHKNPPEAGIDTLEHYPWSSYGRYTALTSWGIDKTRNSTDLLCDTSSISGMFSNLQSFEEFHSKVNLPSEMALEHFENKKEPPDLQVKELISLLLKSDDPTAIQSLKPTDRIKVLQKLKAIGIKASQIARVTGLSRYIISHTK